MSSSVGDRSIDALSPEVSANEQTKVVRGQAQVERLAYEFLERASKTYLWSLTDDRVPKDYEVAASYIESMFTANPSFKFRLIADIQKRNMDYYNKLLQSPGLELRHIEGNKVSFAVSSGEYIATPLSAMRELVEKYADIPAEVVWSTRKDVIFQAEQIFEAMWKSAIPAGVRITEIEGGISHYETRVIRDPLEILAETRRMASTSKKYSVSSVSGGLLYAYNHAFSDFKEILDRHKGGEHAGIRWLTTIDSTCIDVAKKFLELGMEIRHVPNVPTESFGFSENEVGVTLSRLEGGVLNTSALFSDDPMYLEHYASIFEQLWENGLDARSRIKEIEEGIEEPEIRIIRNKNEIQTMFLDLVNKAKSEIMLILPSMNACAREEQIGVADAIAQASQERGVKARMLAPIRLRSLGSNNELSHRLLQIKIIPETISPDTITLLIVDKTHSLILELDDDSKLDFKQAIGVATYSTRGSTVRGNSRLFERVWEAVEEKEREELLLESERKSRREAELLRDILTHDIRNFNQASRSGAEFILEEVKGRDDLESVTNLVIQAIDGSTRLVEKAKKLGMIIAAGKRELRPLNLIDAIDRSLVVVKAAYPGKVIKETRKIITSDGAPPGEVNVLADDFIDEMFTNLFSNSAKFTSGSTVPLDIVIEEETSSDSFWVVTIADYGRGISSNDLDSIFSRYSKGQRGSGLGLSIVQTLASAYGGEVSAQNRSDATGAVFKISLRKPVGSST